MPKENVLQLDDLTHDCQVWFYQVSHPHMVIRLSQPRQKHLYVILTGVKYFSGPMFWSGSNFREETPERCLEILRTKTDQHDLTTTYDHKLYVVGSEKHVEIIAYRVDLYDQEPYTPSFHIPE